MDGMLSQEEINALLGNMDDNGGDGAPASASVDTLTTQEQDAIGEISNICMGTAATTLYSLVNQKVTITTPSVSISTWEELTTDYEKPCVFINISYKEGIDGKNLLILREDDVKVITDLMMGGDGTNLVDELSDLHLSAICEAMNQMMGSSATSLSTMLNKMVDISPPSAELVDLADDIDEGKLGIFHDNAFVKVLFRMEIGDLVDSNIMQLYPIDLAKDLYDQFNSNQASSVEEVKEEPAPQTSPPPVPEPAPQAAMYQAPPMQGQPMQGQPMMGQPMMGMPQYAYAPPMQDVNVQPVQFQPFNAAVNPITQQENIDLIMDVPLEVTVELGRTSKSIKEILEFAPGTIIELDNIAGEPIDVLVNGKLVAKGEVVVIEESFGIRVTDIIKE
ncbi:MAG: flagellar motor switch phosphatase FliY [Lachnospiraceae bacterium]|nr:flagellar motor switch phosphatase FliY [Lachnospiraceae bacterium]MDE6627037.1 flagellar motor switch phosphatase FliY [Lachnospiraceae bacterium]